MRALGVVIDVRGGRATRLVVGWSCPIAGGREQDVVADVREGHKRDVVVPGFAEVAGVEGCAATGGLDDVVLAEESQR